MGWVDPRVASGRVGSKIFPLVAGWVELGQLADTVGWVGSGHTIWTHGQLWSVCPTVQLPRL